MKRHARKRVRPVRLYRADCLKKLKTLEENSVDSLVTDPPAGISFMGKDWDHHKGGRREWIAWMRAVMREVLRVMKPGAHGLVWALPRTSHWTATALEDAGFEVRDCIYHLFGSGFPKSLDVSKAIDKAAGATRQAIGVKTAGIANPNEGPRNTIGASKAITVAVTAPATAWQGWGTALKPAVECWWLVRKPLSENSVAANVLRWGTGALNIDAGRIAAAPYTYRHRDGAREQITHGKVKPWDGSHITVTNGRFPSHLILSEEAARLLDEQSADTRAAKPSKTGTGFKARGHFPIENRHPAAYEETDVSGASRFFYVAKCSRSERNAGLAGMRKGGAQGANLGRRNLTAKTGVQRRLPRQNSHPCVKPQRLMRYLIRLITPPGGLVLDPFAGSGSTGCAAVLDGFRFIGIEQDATYLKIARNRINYARTTARRAHDPEARPQPTQPRRPRSRRRRSPEGHRS